MITRAIPVPAGSEMAAFGWGPGKNTLPLTLFSIEGHPYAIAVAGSRAKALVESADNLLDLLALALPYVEEAEFDPGYKAGAVKKLSTRIRQAIEAIDD